MAIAFQPGLRDPEKDAKRLLETVWTPGLSQPHIPVDPVQIARSLGIQVLRAPMDRNVSGTLANKVGSDPTIYLNESDSINRQRFTCAHEIGHFVRRSNVGDANYEFVDYRDQLAASGSDPEEIYANQFAAALLMPADMVKQLGKRYDAVNMAYKFGVSVDAMNFRLANLRLT